MLSEIEHSKMNTDHWIQPHYLNIAITPVTKAKTPAILTNSPVLIFPLWFSGTIIWVYYFGMVSYE
jgi:hypothetical protein